MSEENTATKNGYNESIPVNIYGCRSSAESFLNTHDCQGCSSLIGPIETVRVPKDKIFDTGYISKISKSVQVNDGPLCKRK
jgi:hypothetical protein